MVSHSGSTRTAQIRHCPHGLDMHLACRYAGQGKYRSSTRDPCELHKINTNNKKNACHDSENVMKHSAARAGAQRSQLEQNIAMHCKHGQISTFNRDNSNTKPASNTQDQPNSSCAEFKASFSLSGKTPTTTRTPAMNQRKNQTLRRKGRSSRDTV